MGLAGVLGHFVSLNRSCRSFRPNCVTLLDRGHTICTPLSMNDEGRHADIAEGARRKHDEHWQK